MEFVKKIRRVYSNERGMLLKASKGNVRLRSGVTFFLMYTSRFVYVTLDKLNGPFIRISTEQERRLRESSEPHVRTVKPEVEEEIRIDRAGGSSAVKRLREAQKSKKPVVRTTTEILNMVRKGMIDTSSIGATVEFTSFRSRRERDNFMKVNAGKVKQLFENSLKKLLAGRPDDSASYIQSSLTPTGITTKANATASSERWIGLELKLMPVMEKGVSFVASVVQENGPPSNLKVGYRTPLVIEFFKRALFLRKSLTRLGMDTSRVWGPLRMVFGGYKPEFNGPSLVGVMYYLQTTS